MNKVILTGNIVRDIEERQTQGNNTVVSNCIAVRRDFKNDKGEYESDFINFVAWGNQATYLAKYAAKGDRIEIVGRWQVRTYQDQYNNNRQANEVVVESITVYNTKPTDPQQNQPQKQNQPNNFDNSDLPY